MTDGVTQKDRITPQMVLGPSTEDDEQANPLIVSLMCDGERNFSSEVSDFMLTRKASMENIFARTVNRHR